MVARQAPPWLLESSSFANIQAGGMEKDGFSDIGKVLVLKRVEVLAKPVDLALKDSKAS